MSEITDEQKRKAHQLVGRAVREGKLIRPESCSKCKKIPSKSKDGRTKIHGHHENYNEPLNVVWLCVKCHVAITPRLSGIDNTQTALTPAQIKYILSSRKDCRMLAKELNVHSTTISRARNGTNWSKETGITKENYKFKRRYNHKAESNISFHKRDKRWRARMGDIYLGSFRTREEAIEAKRKVLSRSTPGGGDNGN